ncbi:BolA/IbaG family iron-sulfur metabolism protein [Alcanivorax sp. JB21]|uniref:BolA family protein n=1 Tax=Alcanivorax limicola TaxID=2874102 RepID=UPI001CBF581A|nr:BolA/IbaG family iron-sulfur metabolism protein [Alcanivorax limicola]MBZ2189625.1 BolA/IbaG family iron-sulfur metabolism protein [Alcanivorax limicola]
MTPDQIKTLIEAGIDDARVAVQGEGGKYEILVIADAFEGLSPVKRQQRVYSCINAEIADGSIHAVTIRAHTSAQWDEAQRRGLA